MAQRTRIKSVIRLSCFYFQPAAYAVHVLLLPGGGTEILISEAYKWAFTRQAQYGYASAYSLLIFGILILYTLATKKVTEVSI